MTGYNYRMSNIQAALGLGQLEHLEEMIRRKREIHSLYEHDFNGIKTPELFTERPWCRSNYWFGVIFMPEEKRNDFIKYMAFEKIQCRPFWKPCHMHPMFHGSGQTDLPVTMEIWKRGVCFPCFQGMSGNDVKKVISVIKTFFRL
jgi:dTDP-4-amino-4,6-dideoxygalactose transaminase